MQSQTLVPFSINARPDSLKDTNFDLIVIGGGVTGCGIALDAASRGLKTLLLEKEDFAAGTSSKSTKLIHGGLRYLKQFEIGLVRETGTERAIVHQLAPHLVLPEKMLLPLIEDGTYGKLATSFGLKVYDVLAGVKGKDKRRMLNRNEALSEEPLLNDDILKGAGFYAEYRTDDARLTIELVKTAVRYGAQAMNYTKVVDFVYNDAGKVEGVVCEDQHSGEEWTAKAKQVVSAAGPWVDKMRKIDESLEGKRLHLTKGVHVVVPNEKLPIKHSVYFDVPDGRMMFAIPRGKVTYIGTTDTTYEGDLNRVVATYEDAKYLIEAVNQAFPTIELTVDDLISNWAGLRPLIHEDGKSPSELSRKDEIFTSDTGLISIAGGKLTGYRKMAQRIVDIVLRKRDDLPYKNCFTKTIALTPDSFKDSVEVADYIESLSDRLEEMELTDYHAWYLTTIYGKQAEQILVRYEEEDSSLDADVRLQLAEVWFTTHYESVQSLSDFFVRRTGRLYFDIHSIAPAKDLVANTMQTYLGWDDTRLVKEQETLQILVHDATHYYEEELV
ncbi:MAG: glycerol-3-phosphate dehydrogenase/oxidase [Bacteroidota bacterium]